MMKRYTIRTQIWTVIVILVICVSLTIYAQDQDATQPVHNTLSGHITLQNDVVSRHPIDIYILSSKEQFIDRTRTNPEGDFEIIVVVDAPYHIVISTPLYLPVVLDIETSQQPIHAILTAGDIDENGCITIHDLAMMTQELDAQTSAYDFTGDDITNVQDLTVVSQNYADDCVPIDVTELIEPTPTIVIEITEEISLESISTTTPTSIPEVTSEVTDIEITEEIAEATDEMTSLFEAESTEDIIYTPAAETTEEVVSTPTPESTSEPDIAQIVTATQPEVTVEIQITREVSGTPTASAVIKPISATSDTVGIIELTGEPQPTVDEILTPISATESVPTIPLTPLLTNTSTAIESAITPSQITPTITADEPEVIATVVDFSPTPSTTLLPTLKPTQIPTLTLVPTVIHDLTPAPETTETVSPP